jgi:hypothetical protein
MDNEERSDFARLVQRETLRRNLRKTADERYETLMVAMRHVAESGQWPVVDRKSKEKRMLCSIRPKLSAPSISTESNI